MRKSLLALLVLLLVVAVALAVANVPQSPLPPGSRADRVVVIKSDHTMTLYSHGKVLKVYKVALGRGGRSAKQRRGDHETPEGSYTINGRNAQSRFHLALHVSYPNVQDRLAAAKLGASAGGDIMVHGVEHGLGWLGRLHRAVDWTDGCIAVTDPEIEDIWNTVPSGTPIEIRP